MFICKIVKSNRMKKELSVENVECNMGRAIALGLGLSLAGLRDRLNPSVIVGVLEQFN